MVFLNVTLPLTVNGHTTRRAGKNGGPFERRRIAGVPVQIIFGMADCAMHRPPPESMVPNFQQRDTVKTQLRPCCNGKGSPYYHQHHSARYIRKQIAPISAR
jgi:hypothetical protein